MNNMPSSFMESKDRFTEKEGFKTYWQTQINSKKEWIETTED